MIRIKKGHVKLERALSKLGLASRTEARRLITAGEVTVNGRVVRDPAFEVVPEKARITIAGERAGEQKPRTILLHKPRGVVTTRSDERGRPTVYSLLEGVNSHVIPVGRLDLATTGLLLLTNDTRFSAWITEPANEVPRVYSVTVQGELTDEQAERLRAGVRDQGELLKAENIQIRKRSVRETHLVVELTEGKNREIRRMFLVVDHEVRALKRLSYGGLELGALEPGQWRDVSHEELRRAFPGAPLKPIK